MYSFYAIHFQQFGLISFLSWEVNKDHRGSLERASSLYANPSHIYRYLTSNICVRLSIPGDVAQCAGLAGNPEDPHVTWV